LRTQPSRRIQDYDSEFRKVGPSSSNLPGGSVGLRQEKRGPIVRAAHEHTAPALQIAVGYCRPGITQVDGRIAAG
jgi:hypothetical protein